MQTTLEVVGPGSFCWNRDCPSFGRVGHGNVIRHGKTRAGVQRYRCRTCGATFTATRGTPFYGVHDPERMVQALALLCERMSLRAVQRVLGVKPDTLLEWLAKAAAHVEVFEALLQQRYKVKRAQLDALWAFVGHKGEKGGGAKRRSAAASGAGGSSTWTAVFGLGGR